MDFKKIYLFLFLLFIFFFFFEIQISAVQYCLKLQNIIYCIVNQM